MKRTAALAIVGVLSLGLGHKAEANCAALPYIFVAGTLAQSSQVNQNFAVLLNCLNGGLVTSLGTVTSGIWNGSTIGEAYGGTGVGGGWTTGSVVFQGASALSQDNSNFFWDATNHRLGLGTATPHATFDLGGLTGAAASSAFRIYSGALGANANSTLSLASFGFGSSNQSSLGIRAIRQTNGSDWTTTGIELEMDVDASQPVTNSTITLSHNGAIGINNTNPTYQLDVSTGDINAGGVYRVGGAQISAANLANGTTGSGAIVLATNPAITITPVYSGGVGRLLNSWLSDVPNLAGLGAIGDGSTDDTYYVSTASSAGARWLVPAGIYKTTFGLDSLTGIFLGPGQIKTSDANLRGPIFSEINGTPTQPSSSAYANDTAFNGNVNYVPFAVEMRLEGAALQNPGLGATRYTPESSISYERMVNNSTSLGSVATMHFLSQTNNSGAGSYAFSIHEFCGGGNSGTQYLQWAGCGWIEGGVQAEANHVMLEPLGDVDCLDDGFNVGCNGVVLNMTRTVSPSDDGAPWTGVLVQSLGSANMDAFFQGTGKANIGLDLTGLTGGATAIALEQGQQIAFGSSNGDASHLSRYTVVGDPFIKAGADGLEFISGGVERAWINASGVNATGVVLNGHLTVVAGSDPGTPAAGNFYVWMDTASSKLFARGPSGTVTTLAVP